MSADARATFELQRAAMGWDYETLARWLLSSRAGASHVEWAKTKHAEQMAARAAEIVKPRETPEPRSRGVERR